MSNILIIDDWSTFEQQLLTDAHMQARLQAISDDLKRIHLQSLKTGIRRSAKMDTMTLADPFEAMEKWLKTLEPMRPDYRAYERVKGSSGMKPKTMNQSRPVGRPMRSVNRNR